MSIQCLSTKLVSRILCVCWRKVVYATIKKIVTHDLQDGDFLDVPSGVHVM